MNTDNYNILSDHIQNVFSKHQKELSAFQSAHTKGKRQVTKRELEVALTIIFVELASTDEAFEMPEYNMIISGLKRIFGTNRTEITGLVNQANLSLANLQGTAKYADLLKENLSEVQRRTICEVIDEIILADGVINGHEIYLRNKFAKALGITLGEIHKKESEETK